MTWKPIKDFPNYRVSTCGKVKSIDRTTVFKNGNKRFFEGRELKLVTNSKGYLVVTLHNKKGQKTCRVHRLVAEAFIKGRSDVRSQVNHIDGDKNNNTMKNLEWCSQYENNHHGYESGLIVQLKNEDHPNTKLTNKDVKKIRKLLKTTKLLHREIADIYNVKRETITRINTRKCFKDI